MNCGGFRLPIGFRFQPSDEQLLSHYLENKNQGKDSQITAIIPEIDVCKHEPHDIPALVFTRAEFLEKEWFTMADSPVMEWYFFSPRDFKHSKSKSKRQSTLINRTTGEGSWKKQGNDYRITGADSNKQIGGKRILTFYHSKKGKTDWVKHEYYLTDAESGQQIGDFVLYRLQNNQLKNNRSKKKSSKLDHDQQKTPGGKPSSGTCSMAPGVEDQASKELENVLPIPPGDDDEAERDGGSCSMAINVKNQASKRLEDILPISNGIHDDTEDGGNSCHIASGFKYRAAEYGELTEAEEYQAFGVLTDAICESDGNEKELKGLQTDKNDLLACLEGQSDSYNSPVSEMVEGLLHEPGNLALLDRPLSPQLQSPIYEECRKRKSPFGDSNPSLTKKNHIDEIGSEHEGSDGISEGYSQGEHLGSVPFQSQNRLSINREPRDFPHDNNYIEWDDLEPLFEGFDSSLAKFSDTIIDGGISDRNIEVAYATTNDCFALAIGPTLQCS
ncbi:NAC domain-containing protein 3-like [Argentina anserina]|uniref:NAC domain-containing protein 3-like n=1 Tax=Argentina anserina TaxID=57926 RepID=UPI0021769494|nr:NAC domain-containing protein 3-like [Potentilla anserina]